MSKKMPYDKHIYNLENLIEIQCADGDVPRLIWDSTFVLNLLSSLETQYF